MKTLPKVTLKQVLETSKGKKITISIKDKEVSVLELINEKESETTVAYTFAGNVPTVIIYISNPKIDFHKRLKQD